MLSEAPEGMEVAAALAAIFLCTIKTFQHQSKHVVLTKITQSYQFYTSSVVDYMHIPGDVFCHTNIVVGFEDIKGYCYSYSQSLMNSSSGRCIVKSPIGVVNNYNFP